MIGIHLTDVQNTKNARTHAHRNVSEQLKMENKTKQMKLEWCEFNKISNSYSIGSVEWNFFESYNGIWN